MQLLLIIEATILYVCFGIIHTQQLRIYWPFFQHKTNQHKSLLFFAALLWPIAFITYITWRMIEPLTKSRRNDWPETAEDETRL